MSESASLAVTVESDHDVGCGLSVTQRRWSSLASGVDDVRIGRSRPAAGDRRTSIGEFDMSTAQVTDQVSPDERDAESVAESSPAEEELVVEELLVEEVSIDGMCGVY